MKKYIVFILSVIIGATWFAPSVAAADVVQMRPLMYQEILAKGQSKRGVVDLSNGSDEKTEYNLSVRLFRQVGDDGSLEFYDQADVTSGIRLDVTNIVLNPKDAARITFSVDSSKLPQGDVFAAIFATTKRPTVPQAIVPVAQVGMLLIIQNGTPGPRDARIDELNISQLQTGDKLSGTVTVTNPAPPEKSTGFFPKMSVRLEPWGSSTKFDGPLVYAGRSRTFNFSVPSNQFGLYKVTVTANNTSESRYVFLITGKWKIIVPLILIALVGLFAVGMILAKIFRHRKSSKKRTPQKPTDHR